MPLFVLLSGVEESLALGRSTQSETMRETVTCYSLSRNLESSEEKNSPSRSFAYTFLEQCQKRCSYCAVETMQENEEITQCAALIHYSLLAAFLLRLSRSHGREKFDNLTSYS
jgi:coproporphyrinogen III oxidase-like Fe-S oxidoreductase